VAQLLVVRALDMRTPRLLLIFVISVLVVLLITPLLARVDKTTEAARWTSPTPLYGLKHPIWLGIERNVAYVDIFSLYPSYQLFITDGGYYYGGDFDIPSTDFKSYLSRCQVAWQTNGVEFIKPDAARYFIPDQIIREVFGPE
jgi:hypothetical protein